MKGWKTTRVNCYWFIIIYYKYYNKTAIQQTYYNKNALSFWSRCGQKKVVENLYEYIDSPKSHLKKPCT